MPLDTAVPGRPDAVHELATWVRSTLGARLLDTADNLSAAARTADAGWQGESGRAFHTRMSRNTKGTEELATTTGDSARAFDDFAVGLHRTQAEMQEIRLSAAAAGLAVEGDLIMEPGPEPALPGPAPIGPTATRESVDAHATATSAHGRWQEAQAAWRRADEAVTALRQHQNTVVVAMLRNVYNDVTTKWFLSAGDMVGAGAAGLVTHKAGALTKEATRLKDLADATRARAFTAPAATPAATIYRDFDDARRSAARPTTSHPGRPA